MSVRTAIVCLMPLVAAVPAIAAEGASRYGLIPENDLTKRVAEIDQFWAKQVKEGSFKGVDAVEIRYAAARREGDGPAVVIASGRTEHYGKYKEVVYDLWRNGYSVYVHDHRGQGLSGRMLPERQKGHVVRFDDYVDDLHAFVTTVVDRPPGHRAKFLLAHSMGGGISTLYLERHPGVFRAAALSSPMHEPNTSPLPRFFGCRWMTTVTACPTCWAGLRSNTYEPKDWSPENIFTQSPERYKTWFLAPGAIPADARIGGPTRHWAAEACRASERMLADAAKIRAPVMVLQSRADEAVIPAAQDAFCQRLSQVNPCKPDGKPIPFDGAGHELFIERDATRSQVMQHVLELFAAHGGAP